MVYYNISTRISHAGGLKDQHKGDTSNDACRILAFMCTCGALWDVAVGFRVGGLRAHKYAHPGLLGT